MIADIQENFSEGQGEDGVAPDQQTMLRKIKIYQKAAGIST